MPFTQKTRPFTQAVIAAVVAAVITLAKAAVR